MAYISKKEVFNLFFKKGVFLRIFSGLTMLILVLVVAITYYFSPVSVISVSKQENQPIYNGDRTENKVALMFNCYEGRNIIFEIAKTLSSYGFKATFFFGGCFADDNVDLVKYLAEDGHEIANHGYFHKDHAKLSYEENLNEIKRTHDFILAQTGISMKYFAPPSGSFSKTTLEICKNLEYKVILWSLDTVDWRDKNEKIVYNRATAKVSGGDFVLMHPKQHTLNALDDILKNYKERGLVVSTVTQCMENNG